MALDSEANPHLLYGNGFAGDLYYAHRSGGTWTEQLIVDWPNYVGNTNSLAIDASDNPHIAFVDGTEGNIYYGRVPGVASADEPGIETQKLRIQVSPDPSSGERVAIRLLGTPEAQNGAHSERPGAVEVSKFDASGRLVRRLGAVTSGVAAPPVAWDLRSDDGRPLSPGVYFVRAAAGATLATNRLTIIR